MKTFNKEQIVGFVNGLSTCEYVAESVEVAELYEHVATEEGKQVVMTQEEVDVLEEALAEVEARIAFVRENTVLVSAEEVAQMVTEGVLEEGMAKAVGKEYWKQSKDIVNAMGKYGSAGTAIGVAGATVAGSVTGPLTLASIGLGGVLGGLVGGAVGASIQSAKNIKSLMSLAKTNSTLKDNAKTDELVTKLKGFKMEGTPSAEAKKKAMEYLSQVSTFVTDIAEDNDNETVVANAGKISSAIETARSSVESVKTEMTGLTDQEYNTLYEALEIAVQHEETLTALVSAEVVAEGEETKDVVQAPIEFSGSEFSAFMTRTWNGTNNDKMIEEFRSQLTAVKTVEDRAALVGRLDSIIKDANTVMADPDGFVKAINAKMFVAGNVSDDTIMSTTADQDGMTVTDLKTYVAGLQAFRDRVNGVSPLASKVGKDS